MFYLQFSFKNYICFNIQDPVTKKFLAQHVDPVFGYPLLVRFSWSTVSLILKTKGVNVEFEESEEQEAKTMKNFFANPAKTSKKGHPYFNERKLKCCTELL